MTINRAPRACCGIPKYTSQFLQSRLWDLSCSWKQNQIDKNMRTTMSTFNTRSGQNSHLLHPRTTSRDNSSWEWRTRHSANSMSAIWYCPVPHNVIIIYRHSLGRSLLKWSPNLLCRSGLPQIWLFNVRINHRMNNNGIIINDEWRAWNSGGPHQQSH